MLNIIFIHGLESSGHGFKGNLFRSIISQILTPDFSKYNPEISLKKLLEKRMKELEFILRHKKEWIIIGSSFGGLMGSIFSLQNPNKVKLLILLAPFLNTHLLQEDKFKPINIPVIAYHGRNDLIVSAENSKKRAESFFCNLTYNIVDDDHLLHKTVAKIEWKSVISKYN